LNLGPLLARQLLAFVIAIALVFATDRLFSLIPAKPVSLQRANYWFNNWSDPQARPTFEHFLENNELVLFGSSELSEPVPEVVHRFFPEELHRPLFAFGAAGAQSLIILIQLMDHHRLLNKDTKLVVILSPWWFLTRGTHPGAMNSFVDRGTLARIYFDPEIPETNKAPLKSYMDKRLHEFSSPGLERLLFRMNPKPDSLFGRFAWFFTVGFPQWLHNHSVYYSRYVHPEYIYPEHDSNVALKYSWERGLEKTKAEQQKISSSNEYGFEDSVWENYKGTVPRELKFPQSDSSELEDLKALVSFLKFKGVHALFINQPINPLAYTHLERFQKLNANVAEVMRAGNMHYVDFMSLPYEKGTLKDLAHFSAYGWLLTNVHIETWLKERE
jgi:D-alanine transfer protein